MIDNQLPDSCKKGKHKLIEVFRRDYFMSTYVIRWCEDCGAVVGDEDYDGRTKVGGLFPMRFPKFPYSKS